MLCTIIVSPVRHLKLLRGLQRGVSSLPSGPAKGLPRCGTSPTSRREVVGRSRLGDVVHKTQVAAWEFPLWVFSGSGSLCAGVFAFARPMPAPVTYPSLDYIARFLRAYPSSLQDELGGGAGGLRRGPFQVYNWIKVVGTIGVGVGVGVGVSLGVGGRRQAVTGRD
jgi:hypothetical protein